MMEFIVNWAVGIVQIGLCCYIASTFVSPRNRSWIMQLSTAAAVSLLLDLINRLQLPFLNMFAIAALYAIFILAFYNLKWYYSIMFSAIAVGVINFGETIMVLVMVGVQQTRLTPDFFSQPHILIIGQCGGLLISLAMGLLIRLVFQKRRDTRRLPQNLAVILFPITSLLTLLYVLSSVADVFSRRQTMYLSLILCTLLVVTNVASLIGNENVRKRYILQNEIDAMRHQEDLTVGLLRQQEDHLREMKAQAHDFKNHLLCLRVLVSEQGPGQNPPQQYIDELLQMADGIELYNDVQNDALRAILSSLDASCKEQSIDFVYWVDYSDFSFMSFPDLSILFSNAFNNAVEACTLCKGKYSPFIDLKILRKSEMLFIHLINSKCNDIKMNRGAIISTKARPENHGIGFKNMERVVKKYDGNITADYDDSEFRLYINLPVRNI